MPAENEFQPRAVAEAFSRALDRSNFSAARALLAADCAYDLGTEVLVGPDAVLESYARSARWAERHLDEVRYESSVLRVDGDRATILYTDYLLKAPAQWHRHRCEQDVVVNADGRIVRIVHRELEREADNLTAYLLAVAVAPR